MKQYQILLFTLFFLGACGRFDGGEVKTGNIPVIIPDYTGVTVPPNIAPLNFVIKEEGKNYLVLATSEKSGKQMKVIADNGKIHFPLKAWKRLLNECKNNRIRIEVKAEVADGSVLVFDPFFIYVTEEPVDPYLAYRLIPPGYYSWSRIRIMQRCLENFSEKTIIENTILDKNCVNCHSFANNDPDRFMVHIRGSKGGTYFMESGTIKRTDPRNESMPGSATYPCWHPGGRFIAYSSNQVRQSFYAEAPRNIEVFDLVSSMIVYDTKENEILPVNEEDTTKYLRTFPGWSSDGKYLYYCRAVNPIKSDNPGMAEIISVHHDLVRKAFDETTRSFGKTEMVFEASSSGKSVSFPRISPDGKFLVFTLHDFGTFPIWHSEADLYSLNLTTGEINKLDLNSNDAESYHSWSHNGRWLVFSSKRSDGRSTRPFLAYIDSDGKSSKPFMLPQKDPEKYDGMIESFNIPEFVTGKIKAGPRDFAKATKQPAVKTKQGNNNPVAGNSPSGTSSGTAEPAHQ